MQVNTDLDLFLHICRFVAFAMESMSAVRYKLVFFLETSPSFYCENCAELVNTSAFSQ